MLSWKLSFTDEESPAGDNLISLFIEVEFEKKRMRDILNIDGLFAAIKSEGYKPLFTCSCGVFSCGGYYVFVTHLADGATLKNAYKPVNEPREQNLIEQFEYELSWKDFYFIASEVYERLCDLKSQYPKREICAGTFGPDLSNRLSEYGELLKQLRSRYEE